MRAAKQSGEKRFSEIDVPFNYGDYYYLEGLLRFKRLQL